jgi:hypothetical protein
MSRTKREIKLVDIENGAIVAQFYGTEASAKRMIKEYKIYGYYLEAK